MTLSANDGGKGLGTWVPAVIFAFVLVSLAVVIFGAKVRKENADGSCSSFFSGESWGDGDAPAAAAAVVAAAVDARNGRRRLIC